MAALTQVEPKDPDTAPKDLPDVQDILVDYDEITYAVTVTPDTVAKGTSVRFKYPDGKLTIVFLSPTGDEIETLTDTDVRQLTIGGSYHFKCFFTEPDGSVHEGSNDGGVIIVSPTRP
ncbi:MAG TPA: hypothetical protein VJW55_19140 [Candidatus Angelobacter sp.]|jgi:hypothetical protein|nr:hypothetical protein [Candidatus Angelobacter sp.]